LNEAASVEWLVGDDRPTLELLVRRPSGPDKGAPVLFLHGAFGGAWYWDESWLRKVCATGRSVAAVSLRGHGRSEANPRVSCASLYDYAADLVLAIRSMRSPPVVVAHSLGGLVAQHVLSRVITGSVALRGLVLVGTLPPEGMALVAPKLAWSAWAATARRGATRSMKPAPGFHPEASGYPASAACGFAGLAQAMIPFPVVPAWAARVPAFVLQGSDDHLVDRATAMRTAFYHGARYETIRRAGHFPMLGRYAAGGAESLCRWLASRGL
jgi:pimeloyl-ACP methyl ester carboxylesterase